MTTVILAGALFLSVPAVFVPHDHDAHPAGSHISGADAGDGHVPVATTGGHDHTSSTTAPQNR